MRRSRWHRVGTLLVGAALCVCHASAATAAETERWQALFAAVPSPPAQPADAFSRITAHRVGSEVSVDIADSTLRGIQRDVDALIAPPSAGSAAGIQQRLRALDDDPQLRQLSRDIDATLGLGAGSGSPPTKAQQRALAAEVNRVLGDGATTGAPVSPGGIAAYRLELQRAQPRAGRFYQHLFEQRRRYMQLHADLDRAALARVASVRASGAAAGTLAIVDELVAGHHVLARQQLAEAGTLFAEARAGLAPAFEHMARLALEAERRAAPPEERVQAYALFKAYIEQLLTIDRFTIEDVGFWAGIRVPKPSGKAASDATVLLYEFALAPDFDLRATGEAVPPGLPYPPGRGRIAVGPPGIR